VNFLATGTIIRSYTGTQKMTLRVSKMDKDADGISKVEFPTNLSIVSPCSTNKFPIWLYTAEKMIPVAHIGSNRMIAFSSSTWVTVQRFHGSPVPFMSSFSVSTAALSRKLKREDY
jgi:hypothetical protein